jgi:hypothetical protein
VLLAVLLFAATAAHAYVDPGTGSYLFQVLLAAFLGSLFTLKSVLRRLRAYFAGRSQDSTSDR